MPDILEATRPSSLDLRAELEDMVLKDLLGPAGGPDEIVEEDVVRRRYILGLLGPKGQSAVPDEDDGLAIGGAGTDQDGKAASPIAPTASMLPSSFGLTFSVGAQTETIQVTVRWGYYRRVSQTDAAGESKRVWQRTPIEGTSDPIPLKVGKTKRWYPDPENEKVFVGGLIRKYDSSWTITLFLINAQTEPKTSKDEAWLFQPELIVRAPDGEAIFIKRQLPSDLNVADKEDRVMSMLYRRQIEFAMGQGVAVQAEQQPGDWEHAYELRTCVVPAYEVERMDAPSVADIPALANVVLDMKVLAETADVDFAAALKPLTDAYEAWIVDQEARLVNPTADLLPYQIDAEDTLKQCRVTLARMRAGIDLVGRDPQAAEAFRFANRAMWQQRVRTRYAREARQSSGKPDLLTIDMPGQRSWYPFQLAFVLLNLPGLVDPTHPDRSHPTAALADLLWFPTGGGKTEAYLGVAAFTLAIRRLQGDIGGYSGHAGVAVLMRYTLRLLTLQQFQRATTLICACEIIRREDSAKWGPEPFRIGLWVGQRSTPNWTKDSAEAIQQNRDPNWGSAIGGKGTPAQLTNCPWCGQPIKPGRDIVVELPEGGRGRTLQFCGDPLGQCPFSRKLAPDEGLPILVVDEEIYRRLPALLIATVDKFAQMPWKGETQMLFGRVNGYCPRHGYRSPEIADSDSHPKRGALPACSTQPIGPLRPPDLIIQDELHLISGPLGTLVGLYETAVDHLASWELNGQTVRPKVIASTATIRRARNQVFNLFLREVQIFPPTALDAEDNFFSRRRASSVAAPARRYIGICAPGNRLKAVLVRVYVAFMSAAQKLYETNGQNADPWMTLVGYFNAMRELGGMRRVVDDGVRTRLRNMDERGLAKRDIDPWTIEELTSRKNATDIPRILDRLEAVFDPQATAQRKAGYKAGERKDMSGVPYDVVLATNMISVGVDVSRLGLMVVASQPKATAEYIQATSRVGRSFPGLVCTVYNWSRPRDLSHYERFAHYHATFYEQVEALSVTPFSSRALDRGLTAVLASFIRLLGNDFNANDGAGRLKYPHPFIDIALREIARRGSLIAGDTKLESEIQQALKQRLDEWIQQTQTTGGAALGYAARKDGRTLSLLKQPSEEDWNRFTCLNSLRDVEPTATLILDDFGMDRPVSASASEVTA
jgi:hypothetical protein